MITDAQTLYEFQVANSDSDTLIKAILREYGGGIFESYLQVAEKKIAQRLQLKPSEVAQKLTRLKEQQILDYQPASNNPQLTFLEARYHANQLPIQPKNYLKRKEVALNKVKRVIQYIEEKNRCRTLMLLAYFDEQSSEKCGVCDFCINERKKENDKEQLILQQLIKQANGAPFSIEEAGRKLSSSSKNRFVQLVRILLETGELQKLENGLLQSRIT